MVAESLSARRAWIEIQILGIPNAVGKVALRKESVDRNFARYLLQKAMSVALRKESVDRNLRISVIEYGTGGRSPQGERG